MGNENYFNTTHQEGDKLKLYGLKAHKQNAKILLFFLRNKKEFTPSQVWINCFNPDETPLTSIRRSMNVLTNKGALEKTDKKVEGIYGRPEYKWRLR